MKNLAIALFVCAAVIGSTAAFADDGSDVTVNVSLVPLQSGSLPTSVTTYGMVVPSHKARLNLSAPIAAKVSDVEVREGEIVDKGSPLVTLVPSPSSRAAYKQAKLALKVANHLLERSRSLAKAHLETASQLAQDEKTAEDAKSTLEALQEEGASGPNTLKAPFRAIIMKINANSGTFVSQGDNVIELAKPEGLVFKTGVVPELAAQIKNGDDATITPFSGSGTFHGKVILAGSVVDPQNGLVPIEISLPDSSMLTGEMGKVVINTGVRNGYVVPHDAVLLNTSGQTYIVQSINNVAKIVPVTVITSKDDNDLVEGKLVADAPVVGAGNYQLDNGTKMKAVNELRSAKKSSGSNVPPPLTGYGAASAGDDSSGKGGK